MSYRGKVKLENKLTRQNLYKSKTSPLYFSLSHFSSPYLPAHATSCQTQALCTWTHTSQQHLFQTAWFRIRNSHHRSEGTHPGQSYQRLVCFFCYICSSICDVLFCFRVCYCITFTNAVSVVTWSVLFCWKNLTLSLCSSTLLMMTGHVCDSGLAKVYPLCKKIITVKVSKHGRIEW